MRQVYTLVVKLTATQFRKRLFPELERALQGETVQISYKGSLLNVVAAEPPSKLDRLVPRDILLCDPDDIVHSDPNLLAELEQSILRPFRL